jgi:choline dehydrogenase-like flavoprotein
VVLEQGPYLTEADFTHNEVKVLNEDLLTNHPKLQPNTFRKTPDEKAKPQRALVYGRLVGGTSVHFTANFWRFHEIDFVERSKIGPIAGTGFTDWPITYTDLEPYYTKVQALSDAAATGKGLRRDFRTGRAQVGLARVPCADGDFVAGAPWTQRLRQLRILSRIWLRSRSEIELAGRSDPHGREDRAL